jgi:hypothetical protein
MLYQWAIFFLAIIVVGGLMWAVWFVATCDEVYTPNCGCGHPVSSHNKFGCLWNYDDKENACTCPLPGEEERD